MRPAEKAAEKEVCNVKWEKHYQAKSKRSTAIYRSMKWLLPHMYSCVTPLPSVEKEKEIHGLVF